MVAILLSLLLVSVPQQAPQEEKPVDKNSARVTLPGCLNGRSFIVVEGSEDRPVGANAEPGRVFRLAGKKAVMQDLKKREGTVVEITGLVRKNDLAGTTQGMPIDGAGRVRVGGGPMTQDPTRVSGRDPLGGVPVLDVESFRPIDGVCPSK